MKAQFLYRIRFLFVIILPLLSGCSLFNPPSTEIVIPEPKGANISYASLSPDGKKLLYSTNKASRFIVDLVLGKSHDVGFTCAGTWLDNNMIFCEGAKAIIDTRDYSIIRLQEIDVQANEIPPQLVEAEVIYRLKGDQWPDPLAFIVLAQDPQENAYITNLPEDFKLPPTAPTPLIPPTEPEEYAEVYSPNEQYYYVYTHLIAVRIYSAADDRLLSEVSLEDVLSAQVLGWMHDSSGVLFRTSPGMLDVLPHPIYKLKVPQ